MSFDMVLKFADEVDSTNNELKRMAASGTAEPGLCLMAKVQTSGRGRGSRVWRSRAGCSMTASFWTDAEALNLKTEHLLVLPLLAGMASAEALRICYAEEFGDQSLPEIGLKWPNDIWVCGAKMGGILCEYVPEHIAENGKRIPEGVVIGIGINLKSEAFSETLERRAASWLEASGQELAPERLFAVIADRLFNLCERLSEQGFDSMSEEWYSLCVHKDKFIKVNIQLSADESDSSSGRMDFDSEELMKVLESIQSGHAVSAGDKNTVYGFTCGVGSSGQLIIQVPGYDSEGNSVCEKREITMGDVSLNLDMQC